MNIESEVDKSTCVSLVSPISINKELVVSQEVIAVRSCDIN